MKRLLVNVLAFVVTLVLFEGKANADRLYLRGGEILEGTIMRDMGTEYAFQASISNRTQLMRLPKDAVRFAYYADEKRARQALGIDDLKQDLGCRMPAKVQILPNESFGEAICQAAQKAKKSIWVSAYYISGSRAENVQRFYNELQRKAEAGLDVIVLCEFGSGTSLQIKSANMEFASTLEVSGIKVRYVQQSRVLHKKLIIIDQETVFVGSANLTLAGMYNNNELNVQITSRSFAEDCVADYHEMLNLASERNELDF